MTRITSDTRKVSAGPEAHTKVKTLAERWQKTHQEFRTVTRVCLYCDEPFEAAERDVKRGFGKFCSLSCASKSHNTSDLKIEVQDPDEWWPLVWTVAARYTWRRPMHEQDEYQDGCVGLLKACQSYRPSAAFSTYAYGCIRHEIVTGKYGTKGNWKHWCEVQLHRYGVDDAGHPIMHLRKKSRTDPRQEVDVRDFLSHHAGEAGHWLWLHRVMGIEVQDIAQKAGRSPMGVLMAINRVRRQLARVLRVQGLRWEGGAA